MKKKPTENKMSRLGSKLVGIAFLIVIGVMALSMFIGLAFMPVSAIEQKQHRKSQSGNFSGSDYGKTNNTESSNNAPTQGSYTTVSKLHCGDADVEIVSEILVGVGVLPFTCANQHFVFRNVSCGTDIEVKTSAKHHLDEEALDYVVQSWMCSAGKKGYYIEVSYGNGGNCENCVYTEIYDLKGNLLSTGRGNLTDDYRETRRNFREAWYNYENLRDNLWLPDRRWDSWIVIDLEMNGTK